MNPLVKCYVLFILSKGNAKTFINQYTVFIGKISLLILPDCTILVYMSVKAHFCIKFILVKSG